MQESVYVVGSVSEVDNLAGTITVDDVVIYASSADVYGFPTLGSVVLVSGDQLGATDLVVADSITVISVDESDSGSANVMSISHSRL